MKNILKNTTTSSSLYGIFLILLVSYITKNTDTPLYNLKELSYINTYSNIVLPYGNILSYTLGLNHYLSPILAIISFIYLFLKKSIKYNIAFSYILTFIFIMLPFGLLNNMNIWYLFFQITTGNILFLTIFCSIDYQNTPTTGEGQIIYGIILGLITSILRFIIPELSVVITLILGPLLFTKIINKISFKLKYNKKYYYIVLSISIVLVIITNIIINVVI
jgi:Na+-translocating ferredoxin:NAD+ oxidoreductase RnfD subunit